MGVHGKVKTSDLFWLFPRNLLAPLRTALNATRNMWPNGAVAPNGGGNGNGHWTYDIMGKAVGYRNLAFIDTRNSSSDIVPGKFFLGIDRSCPPPAPALVAIAHRACEASASTASGSIDAM